MRDAHSNSLHMVLDGQARSGGDARKRVFTSVIVVNCSLEMV